MKTTAVAADPRRRRLAIALLLALGVVVAVLVSWHGPERSLSALLPGQHRTTPSEPPRRAPALAPVPILAPGMADESRPDREDYRAAFARAYAWAGAQADGYTGTLVPLDDAARNLVPAAQRLLEQAPLRRGPGLPSTDSPETGLSNTTMRQLATPALAEQALNAPYLGSGPEAIPSERVAKTLDATRLPNPLEAWSRSPAGPVLVKPGLWADVQFVPKVHSQNGLRIGNRSPGEYAVTIVAEDYGSVRLDGGLVVPGRYYRIRDVATVTGTVKAHVTIRPLGAMPVYVESPSPIPSSNG